MGRMINPNLTGLIVRRFILILAWSFIFAVIYSQSPLYTSNQNQYFLKGLAAAGFGHLDQDWLVNTHDPTPVFTLLVQITYRISPSGVLFYAQYAVLLGIYLMSMVGIIHILWDIRKERVEILILITCILLAHSAGIRFLLARMIAPEWEYLLEGGVAGQRLLGSVYQPSTFGVFLMLSIFFALRKKYTLALIAQTITVYVHPTYLLAWGMLILGMMWVVFREEHNIMKVISLGVFAFLLVLPVVVNIYTSIGSAPAEIAAKARQILVDVRIPHHAIVSQWLDITVLVQSLLVFIAFGLTRKTRLFPVMLISLLLVILLTVIQVILADTSFGTMLALLFPWRVSTLLVPLSVAIIFGKIVAILNPYLKTASRSRLTWIIDINIFLIAFLAFLGAMQFKLDLIRKAQASERGVLDYVSLSISQGDNYLIPLKMQDFRLETGAPAFVDFKSIPYRAEEVLEWNRRVNLAGRFYRVKSGRCDLVSQLSNQEGVTHIVIETNQIGKECHFLEERYKDSYYQVFRIIRQ